VLSRSVSGTAATYCNGNAAATVGRQWCDRYINSAPIERRSEPEALRSWDRRVADFEHPVFIFYHPHAH
jgi:hypothetical protein